MGIAPRAQAKHRCAKPAGFVRHQDELAFLGREPRRAQPARLSGTEGGKEPFQILRQNRMHGNRYLLAQFGFGGENAQHESFDPRWKASL